MDMKGTPERTSCLRFGEVVQSSVYPGALSGSHVCVCMCMSVCVWVDFATDMEDEHLGALCVRIGRLPYKNRLIFRNESNPKLGALTSPCIRLLIVLG